MSSRVNNDCQQQRIEQKRLQQVKDAGKSQEAREKFSKAMTQHKNETGQAKKEQATHSGKALSQGNANTAAMARQGAQAQAKFAAMLSSGGQQSIKQGDSQAKTRKDDIKEHETTVHEDNSRAEIKETLKETVVLAVDPDEGRGSGGQQQGRGGGEQNDGSGPNVEGIGGTGPAKQAQTAQGSQTNAPQLPAAVLEALVKRVLVGVDKAGMGSFVVQLQDNVLGGSTIQIQAKNGKISAKFTAPDENTGRLIKASEGALARALDRSGMSLEEFEVVTRK